MWWSYKKGSAFCGSYLSFCCNQIANSHLEDGRVDSGLQSKCTVYHSGEGRTREAYTAGYIVSTEAGRHWNAPPPFYVTWDPSPWGGIAHSQGGPSYLI